MENEMSLDGYGVSQLDLGDSIKTDGGNPIVAGFILYVLMETVANPVASKNAFWKGFDSTQ
jgi:hypothetical protein